MNQELLERILSCDHLPTLPAIAMRVIELTAKQNVSIDELGETIQNDQGLAAKVLKTVNSSFYGLRRPCTTINESLVMLGLSAVKSLTLSFSLISSIEEKRDQKFDYTAYWRRGLYTAVAAKLLARRAGMEKEDEAFLGGLLQDIGMVAMYRALREAYDEVLIKAKGDHRALVKHELGELELQHPDIGAMLAQRWKLPEELVMPVKYHERPTAAPQEHAPLVRCVAAGNLVHDVLTLNEPAEPRRRFIARCREWFSLDPFACDAILKDVNDHAREMSSLFRLNTGSKNDTEQIIARAQAQADELNRNAAKSAGVVMSTLVSDGEDVDPLTGVNTRVKGLHTAEEAFESARVLDKSLTVLVVSIDSLTRTIEVSGSEAGDVALVEVASFLDDHLASLGAVLSRWDAATFMLVIPGVDRAEAMRIAAEIRRGIESQSRSWLLRNGTRVMVTCSVGTATMEGRQSATPFVKVQQLLTAAARAAESATASGGNTVRTFAPRSAAA